MINNEHKDRLFKFLFGNPENRMWTLNLYNAINNSNYDNPENIQFNTIEEAVYLGMKNNVSFIIMSELNLWKHQSTYNPNMPMRFFIYAAKRYEKYIANSEYYQYSSSLQSVPSPKCICFYNGTDNQPEKNVLKLSEAFCGETDIEVKVTMLNINYGMNAELMKLCKPLEKYSWLVDTVRRLQKIKNNLEEAVDEAISEMSDNFLIKKFLLANKAEVKGMFLTEWDQEKVLEQERRDSLKQGINQTNQRVATDILKKNLPISLIEEISHLSETTIRTLAKTLNITVS